MAKLDGKTHTVAEVEEYVLMRTPAYKYKQALRILERAGRLEVVDPPKGRPQATFKDKRMRVRFVRRAQPKTPSLFDV